MGILCIGPKYLHVFCSLIRVNPSKLVIDPHSIFETGELHRSLVMIHAMYIKTSMECSGNRNSLHLLLFISGDSSDGNGVHISMWLVNDGIRDIYVSMVSSQMVPMKSTHTPYLGKVSNTS